MKYKVSMLAMMIAVSAAGSAWAADYSNSGPTNIFPVASVDQVAVDATGAPVDTNMVNPDGSFKANPNCPCSWVDPSTLTGAQIAAIAADPNAAKFDAATSRVTYAAADTTTGHSFAVQTTGAGVPTAVGFGSQTNTTTVTAEGVNTTGSVNAGTMSVGGVDVGSALADHGNRIATLETSQGAMQVQIDGQGNVLNDHGQKIGQLRTDVDGLVIVTNSQGQRIGDLEGWKVGVDGTLSDHGARIGTLETTSAGHTADIADLKATKANQADLDATNVRVDAHGVRIGNLEDKTQTLSGDASGVTANGNLTVSGKTTLNGGVDVKGGTTTDTLHVTGKSVFDDAVTVNTSTGSTKVTGGGATFTDTAGGKTTISGGDVTSTGTVTAKKVVANGRDLGGSLDKFNGTGGTIENWATGVDNWRTDTNAWRNNVNMWRDDVNATLQTYGNDIAALQGWQKVATAQISNLQSRMNKVEGAAALAMTLQVPTLEAGKRFGISADFGGANSTGAFAAGAAIRLNDNWQLHGGGGAALNGGAWGGRVGVTGQW